MRLRQALGNLGVTSIYTLYMVARCSDTKEKAVTRIHIVGLWRQTYHTTLPKRSSIGVLALHFPTKLFNQLTTHLWLQVSKEVTNYFWDAAIV